MKSWFAAVLSGGACVVTVGTDHARQPVQLAVAALSQPAVAAVVSVNLRSSKCLILGEATTR